MLNPSSPGASSSALGTNIRIQNPEGEHTLVSYSPVFAQVQSGACTADTSQQTEQEEATAAIAAAEWGTHSSHVTSSSPNWNCLDGSWVSRCTCCCLTRCEQSEKANLIIEIFDQQNWHECYLVVGGHTRTVQDSHDFFLAIFPFVM